MLQEKYLPQYHFHEKHYIEIHALPENVVPVLERFDFSDSKLIRFLFKLRGLPAAAGNGLDGLKQMGFTVLERLEDKEIIVGLIGQFWKADGNIQHCTGEEFRLFKLRGFARATWNFRIERVNSHTCIVETETRIACPDEEVRKKFSWYWFFIRPFSGMIRKAMLRSIKRRAELINATKKARRPF